MAFRQWIAVYACLAGMTVLPAAQEGAAPFEKGGIDLSGPYEPVPNWPQPVVEGMTWGRTPTVFAETPNRIFVMQSGMVPLSWKRLDPAILRPRVGAPATARPAAPVASSFSAGGVGGGVPFTPSDIATHCAVTGTCTSRDDTSMFEIDTRKPIAGARWDHILMIFDANGTLVESWDQHNTLFTHPHSIAVNPYDPEHHVWVVDDGSEQIFKFTRDGRLVMTVGEFRVKGADTTHLGGPCGIAFLPNGDFYVSDGYKNTRVVKFNKDGKYLLEWGTPGSGPGQFGSPHGVAVDGSGRVYVADRTNQRVQVFDGSGTLLDIWPNVFASNLAVSKDQKYLWVSAGGRQNKILQYELTTGRLLYAWGTFGSEPGELWGVHGFSVDTEGNLYLGESYTGRSQKLRPRKGADRAKAIGPLMTMPK